jgi:hypothetical protein
MDLTVLSVILTLYTYLFKTRHLIAVGDISRFRVYRLYNYDFNLRSKINGNRLLKKFFNVNSNSG